MVEPFSESLTEAFARVLFRIVFVFEPLAPNAITFYLNRQLSRYREAGVIGDYKAHTKRLGRFHYRISLDLDLTGIQAVHLFGNVFPNQLRLFRRWLHD